MSHTQDLLNIRIYLVTTVCITSTQYRAMHFNAKSGIARVILSVCYVPALRFDRLRFSENNVTTN